MSLSEVAIPGSNKAMISSLPTKNGTVSAPGKAYEVFFSYSHEDETLRKKLETHLALLRRQGLITGWSNRQINAGRDWENEVDSHLETADIILLLTSADFLASDYCYSREMTRAMERHQARNARMPGGRSVFAFDNSSRPFSRERRRW